MNPMLTTETIRSLRGYRENRAERKREGEKEGDPPPPSPFPSLFDCSSNAPHFSRPIFAVKLVIDN